MAEEIRVKGTMLIDFARIIRSNRDKQWDRWLEPADLELIAGRILPSNWYPYSFYRRVSFAVFKEMAHSDLTVAQGFGRFAIRNMLEIYKNIIVPGDPIASINNLGNLRRNFFRGDVETKLTRTGDRAASYHIAPPAEEGDTERTRAFAWMLSGNLFEIVEQTGGKNVTAEIKPEGQKWVILLKWE